MRSTLILTLLTLFSLLGCEEHRETNSENSVDAQAKSIQDLFPHTILLTDHQKTVQNFHVFIEFKDQSQESLNEFVVRFQEKNCEIQCNINLYDSKEIESLMTKYPLEGEEYLLFADHLVGIMTFDDPGNVWMYPYQDFRYKELGGKNWKKEPIQ